MTIGDAEALFQISDASNRMLPVEKIGRKRVNRLMEMGLVITRRYANGPYVELSDDGAKWIKDNQP